MSLPEFDPQSDPDVEPPGEPEPLACIACESENIRRRPRWLMFGAIAFIAITVGIATEQTEAMFFVLAAAAIFAVIMDRWICDECGFSWK